MSEPENGSVARPLTAPGRVVLVTGVLSLVLTLGGSLATVGLGATGFGDPPPAACLRSEPSGAGWIVATMLLMLAGVAIAIGTLIIGRRVPFVLRLPALITVACAIPVIVIATLFSTISYGGEC